MSTITATTTDRTEVVDVTDDVQALIERAGTDTGLAIVYLEHTTAALVIAADEPDLRADLVRSLDVLLADARPYTHFQENLANGEAHVLSALFGTNVTVPVRAGRLVLGRWQRLLLVELDGPQTRSIHVLVLEQREENA